MLRSASHGALAAAAAVIVATGVMIAVMASAAGAAGLPDGRAYEMVSPPQKNGGDVIPDTQRTRAAVDGSAVGFTSLAGFAGNQGTGISSDYMSVRSTNPEPGTNGWTTLGVMPTMRPLSVGALFAQMEPQYVGEFSPDLTKGILVAWGALDGDPSVDGVSNLYLNGALRSPSGSYDLITRCPLCEGTSTPLPDYPPVAQAIDLRPVLADVSSDFKHVAFESLERLTADTPAQPGSCDMSVPDTPCHAHVYEWDDGTVSLAGRVPALPATECDDASGPACIPADVSLAEQGTGVSRNVSNNRTPHAITHGADGHIRLFFTQPTDASGQTSDQLGNPDAVNSAFTGRIFMRIDGVSTVQLNVSEATSAGTPAPAELVNAAADGSRVFFITTEALTNDAPASGKKLYMYDTTKPASAPDNLTLVSRDTEPADGSNSVTAMIGVSDDGRYAYFVANGRLIGGQGLPGTGIYAWHDGSLAFVGTAPKLSALAENNSVETNWALALTQARVTPDGQHLLFSAIRGNGLTGYNHGTCSSSLGVGCRELYVYSADSNQLACASCNPSGAPATAMATDAVWTHSGAAGTSFHLNHALSDDGSRVFFTTGEALVPEDVNGRLDAYEYDVPSRTVHLISTGTSIFDSYFLDASANGDDAFFITRERLVGWDRDEAYDLYDARVGGGFPEPVLPPDCSGDTCQGDPGSPPAAGSAATTLFDGAGNLLERLKPHAARKRCKHGFVRKRVRGKIKCVKQKRHLTGHRAAAGSKRAQQTQRRGS